MKGVDRTPAQMIAYQLDWLDLIMKWDRDEAEGRLVPCGVGSIDVKRKIAIYDNSLLFKVFLYDNGKCHN